MIHVIYIDDNTQHLSAVRRLFHSNDKRGTYHLETFETLQEAVRYAGGFDVVLLDLGLQDSGGARTVRLARQAFGDNKPIVVLTATEPQNGELDAIRAGAVEYLVKQEVLARGDFDRLDQAIGKALAQHRDSEWIERRTANRTSSNRIFAVGGSAKRVGAGIVGAVMATVAVMTFLTSQGWVGFFPNHANKNEVSANAQEIKDHELEDERRYVTKEDATAIHQIILKQLETIAKTVDRIDRKVDYRRDKGGR